MPMNEEPRLVTSEEFVADLLCELSLTSVKRLRLTDTMEDKRFADAFSHLLRCQKSLNVAVDFSLATNPYHGDSSTLREALYSLRERGIVAINNPSFKTVDVVIDDDDADYYLSKSSIPRGFLKQLVAEHFAS